MSELAKQESTNLKILLGSLNETNALLEDTESKLDFLDTGNAQDKTQEKQPASDVATLDSLHSIATAIARKASHISKSTNHIIGA